MRDLNSAIICGVHRDMVWGITRYNHIDGSPGPSQYDYISSHEACSLLDEIE